MSEIDTDSDYLFLKVGALLHDIGHVVPGIEGEEKGHDERGFEFLSSFASTELFSLFAKYHHALSIDEIKEEGLSPKYKNLIWMVREAARLAAGDEVKIEDEAGKHLLASVFSGISGIKEPEVGSTEIEDKTKKFIGKMYYPPGKLDLGKFVYPGIDQDSEEKAVEGCKEIHESFKSFFDCFASGSGVEVNEDLLLMFLEENLSFIPEGVGKNQDISLFDHLKTTCAIASCMYRYHEKELNEPIHDKISKLKDQKYLLVGGDVSGIQDFIYRISSKGALKLLRGRSFYLEMLCEDIVQRFTEKMDIPKANILYSGGGNFFILAPNTQHAKDEICVIKKEIEKWLIRSGMSSSLYLAISCIEFSGSEFAKFSDLWRRIYQENSKKKSRKYSDILMDNPSDVLQLRWSGKACDACNRIVNPKKLRAKDKDSDVFFCSLCKQQYDAGHKLAKYGNSFYIIENKEPDFYLPFSKLKLATKDELGEDFRPSKVYSVNSLDTNKVLSLIKKERLGPKIRISHLPIAVYCAKTKNEEKYELIDAEGLAEKSTGAKKIGALRMDVDHLGKIFTLGLPEECRNLSRISGLSRLMTYFFKSYLNLLGEFSEKSNVPNICNWDNQFIRLVPKREPARKFHIIYAGGDDLFIIGSWDDVFEASFDIDTLFRKYVGENPNITISAGYAMFNNKHPLYQIARTCGEREECAKEEGRNRIFLLDRGVGKEHLSQKIKNPPGSTAKEIKDSIKWDEARDLFHDFKPIFTCLSDESAEMAKAIIRKLLASREAYCENPDQANWIIQLHYFISRNDGLRKIIESERNEELRKYFYSILSNEVSPIYNIDLPLNILDFWGRGESNE